MKKAKTIKISCTGTRLVKYTELKNFQGDLKKIPERAMQKLRTSILNNGFRIPLFAWEGKILDGHTRVRVLAELEKDGYAIPKIPVLDLEAKDEQDAKKILLLINSRYGVISKQGFYEFAQDFDPAELLKEIEIPELRLNDLEEVSPSDLEKDLSDGVETKHECPKCGYEWS